MIFRSPYPDVAISELSLTPFVLQHAEKLSAKPALIDASSDRVLTYGEFAREVQFVASGLFNRGMRKGAVRSPSAFEKRIERLWVAVPVGQYRFEIQLSR